jgi:hypothetical protein
MEGNRALLTELKSRLSRSFESNLADGATRNLTFGCPTKEEGPKRLQAPPHPIFDEQRRVLEGRAELQS